MNTNPNQLKVAINTEPPLFDYRVLLREEPGEGIELVFECRAEDRDHAVEQAQDAYTGCQIVSAVPFNGPLLYVIYSASEDSGCGIDSYWSNQDGWTDLHDASHFSHIEMQTANLPIAAGNDAQWVRIGMDNAGEMATTPGSRLTAKQFLTALNGRYPAPHEAKELYRLRALDLLALELQQSITPQDIKLLERGGRFRVANELLGKCDAPAKHALLHDEHHSVRSAANSTAPIPL